VDFAKVVRKALGVEANEASREDLVALKRHEDWVARRNARRSKRHRAYVAKETTGRVIGVAACEPDKYEWDGILWLGWLYVLSECQGTGVATGLWDRILRDARLWSIRKIYLDTSSEGICSRALAFYAKIGFVEEGRLRDYYEPGEDNLILILGMVIDPNS